jgi:hypothetical protein
VQETLPGAAIALTAKMIALQVELATTMRDETAALHERRAGHQVQQLDGRLARDDALLAEKADLRRRLAECVGQNDGPAAQAARPQRS